MDQVASKGESLCRFAGGYRGMVLGGEAQYGGSRAGALRQGHARDLVGEIRAPVLGSLAGQSVAKRPLKVRVGQGTIRRNDARLRLGQRVDGSRVNIRTGSTGSHLDRDGGGSGLVQGNGEGNFLW